MMNETTAIAAATTAASMNQIVTFAVTAAVVASRTELKGKTIDDLAEIVLECKDYFDPATVREAVGGNEELVKVVTAVVGSLLSFESVIRENERVVTEPEAEEGLGSSEVAYEIEMEAARNGFRFDPNEMERREDLMKDLAGIVITAVEDDTTSRTWVLNRVLEAIEDENDQVEADIEAGEIDEDEVEMIEDEDADIIANACVAVYDRAPRLVFARR